MPGESSSKITSGTIDGDRLLANCGVGLVIVYVCLILIAALFPFDFRSQGTSSLASLFYRFYGWSDLSDWILNIILFVPFGFSLAFLMQKVHSGCAASRVLVVVVSGGLSATVEILQLFLPGRFPAFVDIIANSTGGLMGFLCFRLWRSKVVIGLLYLVRSRHRCFSSSRLTAILVAYFIVACLVSSIATTGSALDTWDENFPLLIGNERTGDRPWRGSVSELIIADRAIPPADVERAFSEEGYWHTMGDSLIGYYHLPGNGRYEDRTGNLPDLSWRGAEAPEKQKNQLPAKEYLTSQHLNSFNVVLTPERWLETKSPPTFMTHAIRRSSQFTLSIAVAAAETSQHGPARVISLSGDPYLRNFTMGQDKADLIFRLRTRLSGQNGSSPELIVPNVFADTNSHRILVVYDSRYFRVYIDDADRSFSLEMVDIAMMNPGIVFERLFSSALPHYFALNLGLINTSAYKFLYLALVFLPMGAVTGLITLIMGVKLRTFGALAVTWILVPAVAVEWIFAGAHTGDIRLDNIMISLAISMAAMLLSRMWATTWLFDQLVTKQTDANVAPIAG